MEKIISAENLFYTYQSGNKKLDALKNITFNVNRGELFGFLGPNGAGKTTSIKLILGILSCVKGELSIFGQSPSDKNARARIGYMPEVSDYYPFLTPGELLSFYADIIGVPRKGLKTKINELLELTDIMHAADRPIGTFSKGMKQKVSFAQSLINDPDLLVLDEPTGGLDPVARKRMREIILDLRDKGKTIFFSSHELSEVELICDRIAIMDHGEVLTQGSLEEVVRSKGKEQTLENYFLEIIGGSR